MNFGLLGNRSVYRRPSLVTPVTAESFRLLRKCAQFLCVFAAHCIWSNRKQMHI
jgi:hypothetical protein